MKYESKGELVYLFIWTHDSVWIFVSEMKSDLDVIHFRDKIVFCHIPMLSMIFGHYGCSELRWVYRNLDKMMTTCPSTIRFFQASGPSIYQTGPWDIVCVMLMSVYMCVVSMEELDLYVCDGNVVPVIKICDKMVALTPPLPPIPLPN